MTNLKEGMQILQEELVQKTSNCWKYQIGFQVAPAIYEAANSLYGFDILGLVW